MAAFRSAENVPTRPAAHWRLDMPLQSCLWPGHERSCTGGPASETDSERPSTQDRSARWTGHDILCEKSPDDRRTVEYVGGPGHGLSRNARRTAARFREPASI